MLNQQSVNPLTRAKGQHRRLLLRAFPVGLLAGLVAVAFQMLLAVAEEGRQTGLAYAHRLWVSGAGWWRWWAAP